MSGSLPEESPLVDRTRYSTFQHATRAQIGATQRMNQIVRNDPPKNASIRPQLRPLESCEYFDSAFSRSRTLHMMVVPHRNKLKVKRGIKSDEAILTV